MSSDESHGFHDQDRTLAKADDVQSPAADDAAVQLAQLLDGLPEDQHQALRLRHLERWSLDRIAGETGKPREEVARLLLGGACALHDASTRDGRNTGEQSSLEANRDVHASETLVSYLTDVDGGSIVAPQKLLSEHPQDAGELQAYFEIAEQLDRAANQMSATLHAPDGAAPPETRVTGDTLADSAGQPAEVRQFGDYELLQVIGAGGMGVVYKAKQTNLNRIVAVKMIRAGQFADEQDVQRFRTEAEATANLRHPHVVAVYDVGLCDGQHFFSMDYVEGESLAEAIRENALPPRRAAELVKTIAETMQFTHGKGILHRDLKPSNILLDITQGGRPLITDFGLAKRTDDDSGMTIAGTALGTPSYAPPEQLEGQADKVGPASDIYSLGATLYELLTGRPPFRASSPLETIRQVIETEPASPRLLNPNLPRDLETICLKCLQKEPESRYTTAGELADELGRFLAGQPIVARPVSRATRAWRWCRRNPMIAGSLAVAAAGVLIALLATGVAYVKTSRSLQQVQVAQQRDAASFRMAREAVDELFTEVSENHLLNQPGLQPLRQELLQRSLKYYQRFLDERGDDETLRDELALAHFRAGLITEIIGSADDALVKFEKARTMQVELLRDAPGSVDRRYALANTLNEVGIVLFKTGQQQESLQTHRDALAIREKLANELPDDEEMQRKLANSLMNIGLLDKSAGRFAEAQREMQQAQTIRRAALERHAANVKLRRDLGKGFFNLAGLALAEQYKALTDGNQQQAAEREKIAGGHLERAIEIFEELFQQHPGDFDNQIQLAQCYNLLADVKSYQGQHDAAARAEAIRLYDSAQPTLETLARMNPEVTDYQTALAGMYLNLAMMQSDDRRLGDALATYALALEIYDGLAAHDPRVPGHQQDAANALRSMAAAQARLGQWQQARESLEEALKRLQNLAAAYPGSSEYKPLVEQTKAGLGQLETLEAEANR